jgi:hypothetical protein
MLLVRAARRRPRPGRPKAPQAGQQKARPGRPQLSPVGACKRRFRRSRIPPVASASRIQCQGQRSPRRRFRPQPIGRYWRPMHSCEKPALLRSVPVTGRLGCGSRSDFRRSDVGRDRAARLRLWSDHHQGGCRRCAKHPRRGGGFGRLKVAIQRQQCRGQRRSDQSEVLQDQHGRDVSISPESPITQCYCIFE